MIMFFFAYVALAAAYIPGTRKFFDGECEDGTEILMYDGYKNDNLGTPEEQVTRCSDACLKKKAPLSGTWNGFVAKGFIVKPNGRCWCESADSLACKHKLDDDVDGFDRYDWEYMKRFDGECNDGTELRMYEGKGDNPGTAEERVARCSRACLLQNQPKNSESWTGFVAKGFMVNPITGRCYCESSDSFTCTRKIDNDLDGYDRYDWGTVTIKKFDGECGGDSEIRMYEGNGDNSGTFDERKFRCSQACLKKKDPLSGTWNGFVAKGFIVQQNGRCYCESSDSSTCTKTVNGYARYDWESSNAHNCLLSEEKGGCNSERKCMNKLSGQACGDCGNGWTNVGKTGCKDVDECLENNGDCDSNRKCINTAGSHKCGDCKKGYIEVGNKGGCKDVDECLQNNGGCNRRRKCINTAGSSKCGDCPNGYINDGDTGCKDVNECLQNNGGCHEKRKCINTPGNPTCGNCPTGYINDGDTGCKDVNECLKNNGGCDSKRKCINTAGGYYCGECNNGWTKHGQTGCKDIDECLKDNGGCDSKRKCINTAGGFYCGECNNGWTKHGQTGCKDIDECLKDNGGCGSKRECINNAGGFDCGNCPPGYIIDVDKGPTGCKDVRACPINNGQCHEKRECIDTNGKITCGSCGAGYQEDGDAGCKEAKNTHTDLCAVNNGGCHKKRECIMVPKKGIVECGPCREGGATGCKEVNGVNDQAITMSAASKSKRVYQCGLLYLLFTVFHYFL